MREELGIDDWLELVKEDKNLRGAYICFAQYMYLLEKENEKNKHYKTLYQSLKKQKEELIKWLRDGFGYDTGVIPEPFIEAIENVLNKMEELEGVNDEN